MTEYKVVKLSITDPVKTANQLNILAGEGWRINFVNNHLGNHEIMVYTLVKETISRDVK